MALSSKSPPLMVQPDETRLSSERQFPKPAEPDQQRQQGQGQMVTVMDWAFGVIPAIIRDPLTRAGAALRDTFTKRNKTPPQEDIIVAHQRNETPQEDLVTMARKMLPAIPIVSGSLTAEFNEMMDTDCGSSSFADTFSTPFVLPPVPRVSASFVLELDKKQHLDASAVKQVNQLSPQSLIDAALEGEASLDTVLTGFRSALQELGSTHVCHRPTMASTTFHRKHTGTLFAQRGEGAVERDPVFAVNNRALRVQKVKTGDTTTAVAQGPDVKQTDKSTAVTPFIGPLPLLAMATSRSTTATQALPRISISALYREVALTYTVLLSVRAPSMALITSKDARISVTKLVNLHGFSRTPTYTIRKLAGRKRRLGQVDEPEKNVDLKRRLLKPYRHRKILIFAGWWMPIFLEPVWLDSLFWFELDFVPRRPPFYPAALILQVLGHSVTPQEAPILHEHGFGVGHSEVFHGPSSAEQVPIVHPPAQVFTGHYQHVNHHISSADAGIPSAGGETTPHQARVLFGAGHHRVSSDSTATERQSSVEFTPSPADTSFETNASSPTEIPSNANASPSVGWNREFENIGAVNNSDSFRRQNKIPIAEQYERVLKEKIAMIEQLKADNQQLIEEKVDISAKLEHVSRKNRRDTAALQREMAGLRFEKDRIEAQLASLRSQHGELTSKFDLACQTVQGLRLRNAELEAHCEGLAAENRRLGLRCSSQECYRRLVEEMQVRHNADIESL